MVKWLVCHLFHRWTRYTAVRYGCELYDVDTEQVCYCTTCGRNRPAWLRE